jgi:glutathione S-transferase
MSAPYRLFGAELSPYSIKVRSVLRYKAIPHEWISRSAAREAEFQRFAKLPLIPVLVGSDDYSHQDSTPILETLERRYPEPSILPEERALQFVSALIEDYADEWVNKAMFHYRWSNEPDQLSAAQRLVDMMFDGVPAENLPGDRAEIEAGVRARMTGRLHHVGSNPTTAPVIEGSFLRLIDLLDVHLAGRSYLFGGRPAVADFGLASQLGQLLSDPTSGALVRGRAPRVVAYVARMDAPVAEGPFEGLDALRPTLSALLSLEVAGCYLPWSLANSEAVQAGQSELHVTLQGVAFQQNTQRYAAKALHELKRKRAFYSDDAALAALLEETGCEAFLAVQPRSGGTGDDTGQDGPDGDDDGEDGED